SPYCALPARAAFHRTAFPSRDSLPRGFLFRMVADGATSSMIPLRPSFHFRDLSRSITVPRRDLPAISCAERRTNMREHRFLRGGRPDLLYPLVGKHRVEQLEQATPGVAVGEKRRERRDRVFW